MKLHTSPLKGLYRCIEKMCLQADERRYRAVGICDVVRCIVECGDCGLKNEVLRALLAAPGLRVRRIKVRGGAGASTTACSRPPFLFLTPTIFDLCSFVHSAGPREPHH